MRRQDPGFMMNPKVVENLHCLLHGVPVGARTHDDTDNWFVHSLEYLKFTSLSELI